MPRLPFSSLFRNRGAVRDLEQAMSLGLPVLGAIRAYEPEPGSSLPAERFPEALASYGRLADLITVPEFHVRGRAIVVTSAESGSWKPSVAANLATLLVRRGSKVVLVDADLRLAARRRAGDGSTSSGFAGLLVNQLRTASSAVVHTLEPKLKLLPVGSVTGTPATLLRSPRLPLVVDQLRDLADYVVFETPSVLAWQESLDLVRLADVTLLVIETGRTRLSAARLTAAMLRSAGAGELGVVLDRAPSWIIAPEVERPQPRMNVRASQVAAAATPPERLELAVGELLADLEDALKLIRSIRQTTGDTGQSKQEKNTELTAIDS